ncbi:MAG: DoxX family protein [Anaerolineae bacterium]|nr:DoxX family protein [Phycisphaerae bacterium]
MNPKIKTLLFGGSGTCSAISDLALAILRVSTGLLMAFGHGKGKLFHDGTFGVSEQLVQGTAKLGFPAPTFFAWCAALAEFGCGILVAIGLFTRPAAAILVFNMAVAAFGAHLHAPIVSPPGSDAPSKELALLYLLPFLLFAFTGAGHFSADAMIRTMEKREKAGV